MYSGWIGKRRDMVGHCIWDFPSSFKCKMVKVWVNMIKVKLEKEIISDSLEFAEIAI